MTIDELCRKAAEAWCQPFDLDREESEIHKRNCLAREISSVIAPEIERLKEYETAIKNAHNGYDTDARAVMPTLNEPASPAEAIRELTEEAELLGEMRGRARITELERENAELRRDAGRYRKARLCVIRSNGVKVYVEQWPSVVPVVHGLQDDFCIRLPFVFEHEGCISERLDAAIDAALKQETSE